MPTPIATLNWSGRTKSEVVNGTTIDREYGRVYLVRDAESEDAAEQAVGLPAINSEFNPGSRFRARSRRTTAQRGPTTWEVTVSYGVPPLGTYPTNDIDPLQRPTVLTWGRISTQRAMQRDRGANPILIRNSAGDMFDPPVVEDRDIETLTATKWFSFYDRSLARNFAGRVNAQAYTLQDTTFLPGEILCKSIAPVTSYELIATSGTPNPAAYVQIAAEFWLDSDSRAVVDESGDPFDAHLVDQGLYGWYEGTGGRKRGRFCTVKDPAASNLVVESILDVPTLLDGSGRPMDPLIKVAAVPEPNSRAYAPEQPPDYLKTTFAFNPDRVSTFDKPGVDGVRMWRFYKALQADFNALPF